MRQINIDDLKRYQQELIEQEKSAATMEKYLRDIKTFITWLGEETHINKKRIIQYKEYLKEHYKISSVNSMLVALNRYFQYLGWNECCVKGLKSQQQMFSSESRELKEHECSTIWTEISFLLPKMMNMDGKLQDISLMIRKRVNPNKMVINDKQDIT